MGQLNRDVVKNGALLYQVRTGPLYPRLNGNTLRFIYNTTRLQVCTHGSPRAVKIHNGRRNGLIVNTGISSTYHNCVRQRRRTLPRITSIRLSLGLVPVRKTRVPRAGFS